LELAPRVWRASRRHRAPYAVSPRRTCSLLEEPCATTAS